MQRTVLITGASRGIGKNLKNHFEGFGYEVLAPNRQQLDLGDRHSVEAFINRITQPIDILVNNAGINIIQNIENLKIDDWDLMFQINVTSAMMLVQHFAPLMAKKNFGRIINISSIYSQRSRPGRCIYSCTKAALDSLTRSAAVEFSKFGVLVNSICPGFIDTELTRKNNTPATIEALVQRIPEGRMAEASELCEIVSFLASEKNTYVTGQTINIDGAFSCT